MPLELIRGTGPEPRPYVCTACGKRFKHRERQLSPDGVTDRGLEDHWAASEACRRSLGSPIGSYGAPPSTDRTR